MPAYRVDCSVEAAENHGAPYLKKWLALERCPDCDRPMRPRNGSQTEWPATVAKAGGGYCSSCYSTRRSHGALGRKSEVEVVSEPISASVADRWSAEERSAAVLIADVALRVEAPCTAKAATENVLDILGLLDSNPTELQTDLNDPWGYGANRY